MVKRKISTITGLVDAFGGATEVAEFLGISAAAVSNWSLRGYIPTGWHLRLYLEGQKRGFSFAPEVFDLVGEFPDGVVPPAKAGHSNGAVGPAR